jgi:hypothetical protein
MIVSRMEEITPYSHPALHIVAPEMRKQGRIRTNRFRSRLMTWTATTEATEKADQIIALLRLHGVRAASGRAF